MQTTLESVGFSKDAPLLVRLPKWIVRGTCVISRYAGARPCIKLSFRCCCTKEKDACTYEPALPYSQNLPVSIACSLLPPDYCSSIAARPLNAASQLLPVECRPSIPARWMLLG